jgi:DNA-binding PadR family transcriptional regulator
MEVVVMPKQKHNFRMQNRDKEVLKTMARTGYITQAQATTYIGIGKDRLGALEKQGLAKREHYIQDGKQSYAFKLTEAGREWVRNNDATINHFYRPASVSHDLQLTEIMLSKFAPEQRQFILTERDIQKEYQWSATFDRDKMSPPDLVIKEHYVTVNQEFVLIPFQIIEITTDNYGREEREMKETFIKQVMQKENIEEVLTYVKTRY